jgi:hypothetical protein
MMDNYAEARSDIQLREDEWILTKVAHRWQEVEHKVRLFAFTFAITVILPAFLGIIILSTIF